MRAQRHRPVLTKIRNGVVAPALAFVLAISGPAAADSLPPVGATSGQSAAVSDRKEPPVSALSGYRLGSGDRIRLIVYGEPSLTGEFAVDGSGQIGVPLIGKVQGDNATAAELEQRIRDKLSPDYLINPSVTVEIVSYRPFYIVGEVRQPGSYPFVSGMTVINAVALSGGFTYRARESRFRIDRRTGNGIEEIRARPDTEVLPGDVISVAERFF